jgi:hypothetical protein
MDIKSITGSKLSAFKQLDDRVSTQLFRKRHTTNAPNKS